MRSEAVAEVSDPDPKPLKRIRATADEWAEIAEAKQGPCRICRRVESNGSVHSRIELHHLIRRSQGGDDVAENIIPLCGECHTKLHAGNAGMLRLLPSEVAYMRSRR